jgi:hypothetical protein
MTTAGLVRCGAGVRGGRLTRAVCKVHQACINDLQTESSGASTEAQLHRRTAILKDELEYALIMHAGPAEDMRFSEELETEHRREPHEVATMDR